jgi:hypothetical protein
MAQITWTDSLGFCSIIYGFSSTWSLVRLEGCGGGPSALFLVSQHDDLLASLLNAYAGIFEEPRGLPPQCRHNHRIHLLPGAAPMAVWSYCYPQLLKDEVERQCIDMLQQCTIRPSTSPFSSPVLLVNKVDNNWCFFVDYRVFHEKTIKDQFLIPVVDELLDELRGA